MIRFWQHWNFSLILLAAYLGVFHLWMKMPPANVMGSGLLAAFVLSGLLLQAALRGYFANRIDLFAHAIVIVDIVFESSLSLMHEGYTFYYCALGFAVVIGTYRAYQLNRPAMPV